MKIAVYNGKKIVSKRRLAFKRCDANVCNEIYGTYKQEHYCLYKHAKCNRTRVKSMRVLFYDCQLFTTIRCIMTTNVYRKPLPGVQQFFNHYHIYGGTHSLQVINDCK